MSRASRLLTLLALLVAGVATLAACGEEQDVQAILEETFAGQKEIDSGRLALGFRLTPTGGEPATGPISARLEGPFQAAEDDADVPAFDVQLTVNAGPQTFTAGAVSTGDAGFLRFQGGTFQVPAPLFEQFARSYVQARREAQQGGGQSFAALGVDPRAWLRDPRIVGEEEVAGADTTHIRSGIDVARLLEDINRLLVRAGQLGVAEGGQVPEQLTPEQIRLVTAAVRRAQMDLWTGEDDRILRRLRLEVDYQLPEEAREEAPEDARGLTSARAALELTLADLGEEQEIVAPQDARPLGELLGRLPEGSGGRQPGG